MLVRRTFIVVFTTGLLTALPSFADTNLSPHWQGSPEQMAPNESLLSDVNRIAFDIESREMSENLMNSHTAADFRQRYDDANRDHDLKANYGLVSQEDELRHTGEMNDFSKSVFNQVEQTQASNNYRKVRGALEKDPNVQKVKKPIGIVAGLVAIYSGEPVNVDVTDNTKISARTDVRNSRSELSVNSPVVNGNFKMLSTAAQTYQGQTVTQDPAQVDERYKVSLSRPLPLFNMSSGVTYGSTTNTVTTSLSKPINDHLTAICEAVHPLGPDASGIASNSPFNEDRVKLLYGIHF